MPDTRMFTIRKVSAIVVYFEHSMKARGRLVISGLGVLALISLCCITFMQDNLACTQRLNITMRGGFDRSLIGAQFNKLSDKQLRGIYSPWTMTNGNHQNFAVNAIQIINGKGVEGDIVECGVWKGGMTMAMVFENMKYVCSPVYPILLEMVKIAQRRHEKLAFGQNILMKVNLV